jgi:hypothetical protein
MIYYYNNRIMIERVMEDIGGVENDTATCAVVVARGDCIHTYIHTTHALSPKG